jgi:hypothetical protein
MIIAHDLLSRPVISPPKGDATKKANINTIMVIKGMSMVLVLRRIASGVIMLVIPTISSMLLRLLPKTFAIASSDDHWSAALILTTNSGSEVPSATMVRPMTRSDMPNFLAISLAPSTKKSAPLTRNANHTTSKIIESAISLCCIVLKRYSVYILSFVCLQSEKAD